MIEERKMSLKPLPKDPEKRKKVLLELAKTEL